MNTVKSHCLDIIFDQESRIMNIKVNSAYYVANPIDKAGPRLMTFFKLFHRNACFTMSTTVVPEHVKLLKEELEQMSQISGKFETQATETETLFQDIDGIRRMFNDKGANARVVEFQSNCTKTCKELEASIVNVSKLLTGIWEVQETKTAQIATKLDFIREVMDSLILEF